MIQKIAFIRDGQFPKISESFIVNKLIFLKKLGKTIEPIIICKKINKSKDVKFYLHKLKENKIKIYEFKNSKSNLKITPKEIIKKIINKIYHTNLNKIRNIIKKEKINTINFVYGKDIKKYYKLRKLNLKIITSFHGFDVIELENDSKLRKICNQNSDLFLVRSKYMKARLIKNKLPKAKIKIQHAGYELEKKYNNKNIKNKIPKIISVGRLVEKKGFDILIKSAKKLKEKKIKFTLEIYGEGPLKQKLSKLIEEYKLTEEIKLKGNIENNLIKNKIVNSDIFVLASKTAHNGDEEGIPVVLMEAMALGTICVSTHHAGIPELIKNNITGFLVPQNNSQKLTNKIITVLNTDKKELKKISQNAQKEIKKEFSYKSIINKYKENIKTI
ncbi:glycosyltransferase [Candidatus Woesearchaeota archaeon]|nr:glycosyltransferase [Candidatus Woesearchaeota archaeon]